MAEGQALCAAMPHRDLNVEWSRHPPSPQVISYGRGEFGCFEQSTITVALTWRQRWALEPVVRVFTEYDLHAVRVALASAWKQLTMQMKQYWLATAFGCQPADVHVDWQVLGDILEETHGDQGARLEWWRKGDVTSMWLEKAGDSDELLSALCFGGRYDRAPGQIQRDHRELLFAMNDIGFRLPRTAYPRALWLNRVSRFPPHRAKDGAYEGFPKLYIYAVNDTVSLEIGTDWLPPCLLKNHKSGSLWLDLLRKKESDGRIL